MAGLAQVGLGAPDPTGFAGAGAEAAVLVRLPTGLVLGGALAGLGHRAFDYRVARLRVAAHVGYAVRRGRFEMMSLAAIHADPWFVRRDGGSAALRAGTDPRRASLVGGGYLQVSPGVLLNAKNTRLRLGPSVRLGGASALGNGGGVARVLRETERGPEALFRLGGLELTAGLDLTVWLPRTAD